MCFYAINDRVWHVVSHQAVYFNFIDILYYEIKRLRGCTFVRRRKLSEVTASGARICRGTVFIIL